MAFNINRFKSVMNRYNGPAKTNLFEVIIAGNINGRITTPTDLKFFCRTVQMPGINFNLIENKPQGLGLPETSPISYNKTPLNCVFFLDTRHEVLSFFHVWMQNIINYNTNNLFAPNTLDSTHFPHEINYKQDYEMSMEIKYYSNDKFPFSIKLEGVYPTEIGAVDLAWDSNDTVATLPVNFSYKKVSFQSIANSSADISRGYLQRSITSRGIIQTSI